ncbi:MAG TPA: hypothetical protein VMF69_13465 [Gemmataceae bacterium]|nr:hypothetical protein [Gemmataceae bacterium]
MPPETDLIKQQMGQTRASLSEKLQTLENKVVATVSSTTETVSRTVNEVGATVCETAQNVRGAMNDTMSSVRDALDVSRQFHRHPWLMVGGSVAAGYVGGVILDNLEQGRLPSLSSVAAAAEHLLPQGSEVRQAIAPEQPVHRRAPAFLQSLAETFAPELDKLKAAAVGLAFGLLRDKISGSVPPQMREDFTEMMDRLTAKLGGHPHPAGTMYGAAEEFDEDNGARAARPMGMG